MHNFLFFFFKINLSIYVSRFLCVSARTTRRATRRLLLGYMWPLGRHLNRLAVQYILT